MDRGKEDNRACGLLDRTIDTSQSFYILRWPKEYGLNF